MKTVLAAILVLSAGCGYVDGACWARDDADQGSGGGPIVPGGVGGYGDSYAEPQGLDPNGDMPEECWIEACHDKCDRGREEDLHGCQKLPVEKQEGCRQRAKESAAECHKACDDDPIERCKRGCDKIYNECMDRCKDRPLPSPGAGSFGPPGESVLAALPPRAALESRRQAQAVFVMSDLSASTGYASVQGGEPAPA